MRKFIRRMRETLMFAVIFCIVAGISGIPAAVHAEETAVFHVQASEVKEDGTIRVSVYLTDTENLGGIDAELVYDPGKVTYVSSGLGRSFTNGFGQTNCDEAASVIKCVTIYEDAKAAHGELMYAVFKLNGIESYQPEFRVIDMLDATAELNSVPYTITYQQADGNWTETRDTSETAADGSVIAQALEAYGAPEDKGERPVEEGEPIESRILGKESQADEGADHDEDSDQNEKSGQAEPDEGEMKESRLKSSDSEKEPGQGTGRMFEAVIGFSVLAVIVIIAVIVWKRR